MTVQNETRLTVLSGNGSTVAFPFSFKVFTAGELAIYLQTTSAVTLLNSSQYSISLNSNQNTSPGGTVTLTTAPASGEKVMIKSNVNYLQERDINNQYGLLPEEIEKALDKDTIQALQLKETVGRCLKLPLPKYNKTTEIPFSSESLAGKALVFDASENINTAVLETNGTVADVFPTLGQTTGAGFVGTTSGLNVQEAFDALDLMTTENYLVDTIADLRNRTISGKATCFVLGYYAKGDAGGGRYQYDSTDTTSTDNGGSIIVATDGGRWKLITTVLSLKQFGAKGDNTTDDATAISNWFAAIKTTFLPGYVPPGTYKIATTTTTTWDFSSVRFTGAKIYGAGSAVSVFNIAGITSGIGLHMKANADWFDLSISDVSFIGSYAGVLVAVGDNSFVDPLNVCNFTNVTFLNSANSTSNVALRLNYIVNSNFIGCRANSYANGSGTNEGVALECRQVEFTTFTNGSYGNAEYGVRFKDGYNFANVFIGTDHENVDYCVSNDSANSGNNTFIGGQFSLWVQAAFKRTGSLSTNAITAINGNYSNGASPAPIIDATNYGKIRLIDGATVTTPSLPSSGVNATNTTGKKILVVFWGGTISSVSVNGFGIGLTSGSVVVDHGETVSLSYSGSPYWIWQKME